MAIREKRQIPEGGIKSNPLLPIRVSTEEKEAYIGASKLDGFKSLGTWIKHLCRARVMEIEAQKNED